MIAILDNIRSIHNVGSIFRTADALGLEKIYLGGITSGPLDSLGRPIQKFVKVSLGAENTVVWEKVKSVSRLVDKLKKEGHLIISVEQAENSVPYFKLKSEKGDFDRTAFIFGNEVDGITKSILRKSDKIIEIPMRGAIVRQDHHPRYKGRGKESLNVAVSFGIVMFNFLYGNKRNQNPAPGGYQ